VSWKQIFEDWHQLNEDRQIFIESVHDGMFEIVEIFWAGEKQFLGNVVNALDLRSVLIGAEMARTIEVWGTSGLNWLNLAVAASAPS
jgi:hypothetical protein